jgi:gamma-glutamylcyclotransferase
MIAVYAYGSNMLTARMMQRAPSARVLGPAFLERFVLRWNKRSKDGSGKCSIEETGRREDFVWGVVYEMTADHKKDLDRIEGLGRGYGERLVNVLLRGNVVRVCAYYATSVGIGLQPYDFYRDLVVAGAREHALPEDYIHGLEAVSVVTDPNRARAARESIVKR